MKDNPYAAPASTLAVKPLSAAAIDIRSVSRAFRFLGWTIFVMYLPITLASLFTLIRRLWESGGLGRDKELPLVTLICAFIAFVAWMYIRVGRRLLARHTGVYRWAFFLSCLLTILLFPLGILCLWYLRKHWKTYCAEQEEEAIAGL